MSKKILLGLVVLVLLAGLVLWSTRGDRDAYRSADVVLNTIYSQSIDQMRNICGDIGKNSQIWVPIISQHLRQNYGRTRDIKTKSYHAGMWTYQVTADQGEYEMRITKLDNGKIGYIGFRFPPSNEWVHMTKITNLNSAPLQNGSMPK